MIRNLLLSHYQLSIEYTSQLKDEYSNVMNKLSDWIGLFVINRISNRRFLLSGSNRTTFIKKRNINCLQLNDSNSI